MTDEQLRALVREAVARHLGAAPPASELGACGAGETLRAVAPAAHAHPSHHLYVTVINSTDACVIEPSVTCDHCGYCKSHGH